MTDTYRAGMSYGVSHYSYTEWNGGWCVVVNVLPYGVHVTLSHPQVPKTVATATVPSEECRTAAQAMINKLSSRNYRLPELQGLYCAFGQSLKKVWFANNQYEQKLLAMLNYTGDQSWAQGESTLRNKVTAT